jgi:hypothetical protein
MAKSGCEKDVGPRRDSVAAFTELTSAGGLNEASSVPDALDRRVAPEAAADRLGERLRAVDDEQTRHRWIEAALD